MANARKGNVIYVDTTAQFSGVYDIKSIKYVGATSGTASVTLDASGGTQVWEHSGDVIAHDEVCIRAGDGMYVAVTNSAAVYIYLK